MSNVAQDPSSSTSFSLLRRAGAHDAEACRRILGKVGDQRSEEIDERLAGCEIYNAAFTALGFEMRRLPASLQSSFRI